MTKIFVFSDTHGNLDAINRIAPIIEESDVVIHLGDNHSDLYGLSAEVYDKLYSVNGNCDGGGDDVTFKVENLKVLITHGDKYGVKTSLSRLYFKAKELGVNVVFYGHTHLASVEEYDGITFINPGCMTKFAQKSYCYCVVTDNKITAKIVYLD